MTDILPEEKAGYLAAIEAEERELRGKFPAIFFYPNVYQERYLEHFRRPKNNGHYPFMAIASAGNGAGKAIPHSTVVPTPQGNREWGSIRVGDTLFGRDGQPTLVTALYPQGVRDIYKIRFDDGAEVFADGDHLWSVRAWNDRRAGRGFRDLTTREIIAEGVTRKAGSSPRALHFEIPRQGAARYSARAPLDGYLMGCWLGDGSCAKNEITKSDTFLADEIERRGFGVERVENKGRCSSFRVRGGVLKPYLGGNTYTKKIPDGFLTARVEDRLDLLRGLMDTDGSVERAGSASAFYSSSILLATGVLELARSLGAKASLRQRKTLAKYRHKGELRDGAPSWIVSIASDFCPFLSPAKAGKWVAPSQARYLTRFVESIEFSHREEASCVTVDAKDSLYLVNDYVVTHNTACLAAMMVGSAFGKESLGDYFQDFQYFDDLHKRWLDRGLHNPLHFRIICESGDMEEGGSLWRTIQEWFPVGRYQAVKGKGANYAKILCDNGVVFDVRTHEQKIVAHAGANPDAIFINEPFPQAIWAEMVGRTRGGATIVGAMTPDRAFGWMQEPIYDAADGTRLIVEYGTTWDNCKDIPGTRGHLSKYDIENMIEEWRKLGDDVLEARLNGRPKFNTLAVYPMFSQTLGQHIIRPMPFDDQDPVYCIIDPHDIRAPAIAWFVQSKHEAWCVAEWPAWPEDYARMGPTKMTISQVAHAVRDIERRLFRPGQVCFRFMDPNKGPTRYGNSGMTVQEEYAACGLHFDMALTDDLEVGHNRVRESLWFDSSKPCVFPNIPFLRFFETAGNVTAAMTKYSEKRNAYAGASLSARLDPKYKDMADVVRYFMVSMQPYEKVSALNSEADTIYSGRYE